MQILLIEDDQFKQELVEGLIKEIYNYADIFVGRSVRDAVILLRERSYDHIVLDIALPSHENRAGGAQPISNPSGGVEVLLELSYEERSDPVTIVTQYPEIEFDGRFHSLRRAKKALCQSINVNIIDVILFNAQEDGWRERFKGALL